MLTRLKDVIVKSSLGVLATRRRIVTWVHEKDPVHYTRRLESGDVVWSAFVEAGRALAKAHRFDEADQMFERGLAVFPNDPALLSEYALSAHHSGKYPDAIRRWERALEAAPDDVMTHAGLAANFRETGQLDRASGVIEIALARFGAHPTAITEAARIAEARGRFDEALAHWHAVASRPLPHPDWLRGEANALLQLGRFEEAGSILRSARTRHPTDAGLHAIDAILASSREDWSRAVELWTAYAQRFPADAAALQYLGRAQAAVARRAQVRAASPTKPRAVSMEGTSDELSRLLLGFESIGDNWEFGTVQKRCAADPPGLLRWNSVSLDGLISGLGLKLAGLGDAANTELATNPDGELVLRDRRWGLETHTFVRDGLVEKDDFYTKMCRRIGELKDKFLADLADAEKVFVYRSAGIDADRLEALHRALRAFGPVRLLSVQPAAPLAPTLFQGSAGDVVKVEERRFVGFLERLGVLNGPTWDIAFDDWISVCRKAASG